MKRAQQIEAALGRTPQGAGYLAQPRMQSVGFEPPKATEGGAAKTPFDPQGLLPKKGGTKPLDPRMLDEGSFVSAMGRMQNMGPGWSAFAHGAYAGKDQGAPAMLPNAIVAPPAEPVKSKGGKLVVRPGEAVAIDEAGRAIDARGKKLGYLNQPAVVTPYGDMPLRTGERRYTDVIMGHEPGALEQTDPFAASALEQRYGKHLRKSDVDQYGMPNMKFPKGYFKGKSEDERKDIISGVRALATLSRGMRT